MRFFLFLVFVLFSAVVLSQQVNDSIVYDTIQLDNKTIIKKQVIKKEYVEKSPLAMGYFSEVNFSPVYTKTRYANKFHDSISTNLRGYSTGICQNIIINNYLFQIGITYLNLRSSFDYQKYNRTINTGSYEVLDTINVHYYIINGDSVPGILTEPRIVHYSDTSVTYNHLAGKQEYHFINIPVLVGYRFRAEKFAFYIKTGVYFQVLVASNGQVIEPSSLTLNKLADVVKKKCTVTSIFGLGIEYPFSNRFSVMIEPVFHKDISGFNQNSQIKNADKFGVQVGLQYWF